MIFDKLEILKDCLQFSFVCHSWHCVTRENERKLVKLNHHQVPMLLVPSKLSDSNEWSMYNVLENKFFSSKLVLPSYDRPFGGSSEGWLITLDENLGVTLYKPFTESKENTIICLPPPFPPKEKRILKLTARFREYFVMKMTTFTPNPLTNPKDLILVVIFGEFQKLAYISTAKDSMWTHVASDLVKSFDDVVYYKNKFYALTAPGGALVSFDAADSRDNLNVKLVVDGVASDDEDDYNDDENNNDYVEEEEDEEVEVEERYFCYKRYLVESFGGDLLHVKRYIRYSEEHETMKFRVFKWNLDVLRWVEITSLGDYALFLGDNTSICVLASNFVGCEKNSIYYTHDKDTFDYTFQVPMDLGVYNLETGVSTRGFTFDEATREKIVGPQPIWVLPTFII